MEIKILQVFYGKDGLPYKDKDRQVHFPIAGTGFLGASNTTQIRFYYEELSGKYDTTTTWVSVSKLPNGKIGSRVLESFKDEELNEYYALLELDIFYTQYKGDVFISLQGYQGGVNFDFDEERELYEINGTPTIAATGSIKFTINYANQFIGSGETDNVNFQKILALLGTKVGMRTYTEHVEELPEIGDPNFFYVVNDDITEPTKANIYMWNDMTHHYVWIGDNSLYLGNYYTKAEGTIFENELNAQVGRLDTRVTGNENRIDTLSDEISNIAGSSPRGVFATLSDLQTAYPSGTSGLFVVLANGHWYYYNTGSSSWTDGGVYQSTGIGEGSIVLSNLSTSLKNALLISYTDALPSNITDLNNFPGNSAYGVYSDHTSTQLANCPYYPFQGAIRDLTLNVGSDICRLQIVQSSNNADIYMRMKWASWGAWKKIASLTDIETALQNVLVSTGNGEGTVTNLDSTSIINKAYYVATNKTEQEMSNCPYYPFQGLVFTLSSGYSGDLLFQYALTPFGDFYTRVKWGSWTSWQRVSTTSELNSLAATTIVSSGNGGSITDLNSTSIINKAYYVATNKTEQEMSNCPYYPFQGLIITRSSGYSDICVQDVYSPTGEHFHRTKWASWNNWVSDKRGKETPLDISLFTKVGVVGDSFASGELYNSSGTQLGDFYDISWLQIMARKNGFTGYNFSVGGETTTDFLVNPNTGLPKLKTTAKCGLYLLCLGINDSSYTTLGSISDINDSDPTQNPNTFYGNYGRIIAEIQNYSPESRLIMFTMAFGSSTSDYNTAIKSIASHFGIPCVDVMENEYFSSTWYSNNMYSNHPTAPVYAMMSKQYQKMIEECMFDNVSYFRDYTGQNLS